NRPAKDGTQMRTGTMLRHRPRFALRAIIELTMGGPDPPTQRPRVRAANDQYARADARALVGRLGAGHGEVDYNPARISLQAFTIASLFLRRRWNVPLFKNVSISRGIPKLWNTASGSFTSCSMFAGPSPMFRTMWSAASSAISESRS